jgi:hypothetical protein
MRAYIVFDGLIFSQKKINYAHFQDNIVIPKYKEKNYDRFTSIHQSVSTFEDIEI